MDESKQATMGNCHVCHLHLLQDNLKDFIDRILGVLETTD